MVQKEFRTCLNTASQQHREKNNDRKVPHMDLAGGFRVVGCSDSAISHHDVNIGLRADGKAALVYRVGTRDLQTALSSRLPYLH